MEIKLPLHTLVLLVGPSNSGKSYFSKNVLAPKLNTQLLNAGLNPNVHYLSSDDFRRDVVGQPEAHKYDSQMMHVSKKAFNILHTYIDNLTEFPNPAHYIIVDTTGLSKSFRDQILAQAKEHNYNTSCIIFDYKKMDDFFRHSEGSRFVTRKHIERMRKHFWKDFNRKEFGSVYKIKEQDFSNISFEIPNVEDYKKCLIPNSPIYDVIGDVHGCGKELTDLVVKLGYKMDGFKIVGHHKDENRKIIMVGDLIDKGYNSKGVLNFVLNNLDYIQVVKGNHENFTAKWHRGLLEGISMTEEFRKKYFSDTFSEDEELIELIKKVDDISTPFLMNNNLIVTHAPAMNKDLGKINKRAYGGQVRGKSGGSEVDWKDVDQAREFYGYLYEDAERSYPLHIFGHSTFEKPLKIGNKIGIDTGCVYGGKLTAATVVGSRVFFTSVSAEKAYDEGDYVKLEKDEDKYSFDMDGLTGREIGRIKWSAEDKINFISGTMSPSAASDTEIEPLSTALDYFKNAGVNEVVIQPKYMGSRCNVYLHRDEEKCFATSRKGFKIKEERVPDLNKIYKPLQKLFDRMPDAEVIVLDGELLPWDALGKDLIEGSFNTVAKAIETELDMLDNTGFDDKLKELLCREEFSQYKHDQVKMKKKDLAEKYGHHNIPTYRGLMKFNHRDTKVHREALAVFKRQLEVFGKEGEIKYSPFDILKVINKDGTEEVLSGRDNLEDFMALNESILVHCKLDDKESIEEAKAFFKLMTKNEMEGIVIKPRYYKEGVAPFMKVRNENYLTITYGYDYKFPEKYERLLKSKKIGRKLKTSIKEYELGRKMLSISQKDITKENDLYRGLVANIIFEEKKEEKFDPRL